MKPRSFDLLSPLGLVVILGSFVADRRGVNLPGGFSTWAIVGAAMIVAHLLLRFEDIIRAIGGRQLRYGASALVLVVAVGAIFGIANWWVNRHGHRWDLTKNQRYSLSDQSRKVLAGLKDDVHVFYFQRAADVGPGQERMKDFTSASPKLKVEFVDPVAEPIRAARYDARGPYPVLVVERGERRERLANDSEQDITNAILKVTKSGKRTACFVTGEGERDPDDGGERGYSQAKAALGKSQYDVKKVLLLQDKTVPADCSVVVVAGPEKDPLPPVIDALRDYVKKGGKALLMVEPEFKDAYPNLTGLAKEWNLEFGKDLVVDASGAGQLFGTGPLTPIVAEYPYHEITKDLRGVMVTIFHEARTVEPGKATIDGVATGQLLQTSPRSWAETDLKEDPLKLDPGKDRQGPISLGAWATIRASEPAPAPSPSPSPGASPSPSPAASPSPADEPKKPEGRVVAIGDSDYASNTLLRIQGNQDLFLNTVAWLSQDTDLISIRPKEPDDQRMTLTANQQLFIAALALLAVPGLFIVLGGVAWWVRR